MHYGIGIFQLPLQHRVGRWRYALMIGFLCPKVTTLQLTTFGLWKIVNSTLKTFGISWMTRPIHPAHPSQPCRPPENTPRFTQAIFDNTPFQRSWFLSASSHCDFWAGPPEWTGKRKNTGRRRCCMSQVLTPRGAVVDSPCWDGTCYGKEGEWRKRSF